MKPKILISWSGGKDSAWALHLIRLKCQYEIVGLLTTVNSAFDRVAIHGFPTVLLQAQAERLELPLWTIPLPHPCSNAAYESAMADVLKKAKEQGIQGIAFGDLFLQDVREYREQQLSRFALDPVFPLWGLETQALADCMIQSGVRARLACIDLQKLPSALAGRDFDAGLLRELPEGTDHCGEKGEFHTFVHAGPMFKSPIPIRTGITVHRDHFAYADFQLA